MLDVGYMSDLTDEARFVAKRDTNRIGARVAIDLFFMTGERGYPLSYLAGNQHVWELKRDVASAQRDELSGMDLDRKFHDVFLHAGNMPVSYLRRVFAPQGLL